MKDDLRHLTIDDIIALDDYEIRKIAKSNPELLKAYAKKASTWADTRRSRALKALENNPHLPTPIAYQGYKKDDKISGQPRKQSERSWVDADFSYNNNMKTNEYVHLLQNARNFLETKTSRKSDFTQSLTNFKKRLFGEDSNKKYTTIKKDEYSEFWKIVNTMVAQASFSKYRYEQRENHFTATNEFQKLVWDTMHEQDLKFTGTYDAKLSVEDDRYAQDIIKIITKRLNMSYEEMQREEYIREEQAKQRQGLSGQDEDFEIKSRW